MDQNESRVDSMRFPVILVQDHSALCLAESSLHGLRAD
jgi:hypothetical protein